MAGRFLSCLLLLICTIAITVTQASAQCRPVLVCNPPVTPVCDQPVVPMAPCCTPSPLFPPPPPLVVPVIIPPIMACAPYDQPPPMLPAAYDQPTPTLPSKAVSHRPPGITRSPMR
jgi:hypothetical protein